MGTPRYDSRPVAAQGGSISMGTPRYEPGAGRGTPPMHPEGAMAPRMPNMYDQASMNRAAYDAMRMMHDRSVPEIYRRLSPTGQYYAAAGMPYQQQHPPGAQYPPELSSSRAVLMGDFLTAQQMQHQEAQRRVDKERQLSPRSREPMVRDGLQGKNPYPGGVLEAGMPPPSFGPIYVHPGQVPSSQDRVGGRTSSPMPPRDATPPRSDGTPGLPPSWSQGHPGVRGPVPSQGSPGGGGALPGQPMAPDDHRHPTPPPPRQNVIRSITHGTAGSMIMDQRISPRPTSQGNTHLNGSSPFATLVNVAVNAPSLAVPPKDRHQLSPVGLRDHPNKERAHAIAMEQERERQEREKERHEREAQQHREVQPREMSLSEAHREAQYREAQQREAQLREAQQRGVAQHREAQAREAQAREAQAREAQAREAQAREVREAQVREAQAREAQAREAQQRGVQQQREVQRLREMERREQERLMIQ